MKEGNSIGTFVQRKQESSQKWNIFCFYLEGHVLPLTRLTLTVDLHNF